MSEEKKDIIKRYTLGEEIFNSVSHGVGVFFAVAGCAVLIVLSAIYANMWAVIGSIIYGISMFSLYLASTLYHSFQNYRIKEIFRVFDHCTIFLLIAGTYTPFTLYTLRDSIGLPLFAIIWLSAIVGIVLNAINLKKFEKISLVLYLIMGWAVVFAIKPLVAAVSLLTLVLLILGGLMYTVGVIFYCLTKYKYMHSIWHLFVLAGTILHYFAILFNIIGM
ncbi:hemolysin III family protein [Anaerofustis sp. NSJ-163]|uniref:PAQR family membrane homeostasis protein TrhA n=1 Tax=Anaerofustis sp. NSJ-163 TaxID=2944391 RepID=UPI00209BC182|nr:hemolysin III family protein [Anaerofustis sp. NSJ-163]MCO8194058.1 hemolysin III family protein [Anaerofustis sp. NSJ-163]